MISLLVLLAAGAPNLTLRSGYYTLAEIARILAAADRRTVSVAPACASDIYAARFDKTTSETLLAALGALGRVRVLKNESGYTLSPDPDHASESSRRYRERVSNALRDEREVCAAELAEIDRLQLRTQDERDATIAGYQEPAQSGFAKRMAKDLYLYFGNEMPFAAISFPPAMIDANAGAVPTRLYQASVAESPNLFAPQGRLDGDSQLATILPKTLSKDEFQLRASEARFAGKFAYDPVQESLTFRLVLNIAIPGLIARGRPFGPSMIEPLTRSASVPEDFVAERRVTQTRVLAGAPFWSSTTALPQRPWAISGALLRCAEGARINILCYLGGFSDRALPARETWSFNEVLTAARNGAFDPVLERERSDQRVGLPTRKHPRNILTAQLLSGVLIVRDEQDFLDLFTKGEDNLPVELMNAGFSTGRLDPRDLIRCVARLHLSNWTGSIFPESYLPWCNPISLYPFARLFTSDTRLLEKIIALPLGDTLQIPLNELEPPSLQEFRAALSASEVLIDTTVDSHLDPATTTDEIAEAGVDQVLINVMKSEDHYEFRLTAKGHPLWSSKMRFRILR